MPANRHPEERGPNGRTPREALGFTFRTARENAGLSRQELADATDMSKRTIGDLENNRTDPKWETLQRIADALETPLSELTEDSEHNE